MRKSSRHKATRSRTGGRKPVRAQTKLRASKSGGRRVAKRKAGPQKQGGAARPASASRANRQSLEQKLGDLKRHLREISDLSSAGAVLSWDHATYMPKGGA